MLRPLLVLLTLSTGLESAFADTEIALRQREPVGLIVVSPTRARGKLTSSEIARIARPVLEEHTNFYFYAPPVEAAEECGGSILCFVELLRSVGGHPPKGMLVAQGVPRYLLVLTHVAAEEGPDLFGGSLIDLDAAVELASTGQAGGQTDTLEIEAKIIQDATLFSINPVQQETRAELEEAITSMLSKELRQVLEARGEWDPFGSVEIEAPFEGLTITFDSRIVETTKPGLNRLLEVPAGEHTIELTGPGFTNFEANIQVERGKTVRLTPAIERTELELARYAHPAGFWTGAALAATGATLGTIALVRSFGRPQITCAVDDPVSGPCPVDTPLEQPAPIGLSLLAGGLGLGIGTMLTPNDEVPWLAFAAGLAASALTAGLIYATNPDDPLPQP